MDSKKIKEILNVVSGAIYSSKETQQHSFDMGKYVSDNNIQGDVIECGVAAAGNFASMILGYLDSPNKTSKTFWGFDSFQGIQLAGKKDTVQAGIGEITHDVNVPVEELLVSSGITVHPKQQVISNLTSWQVLNSPNHTVELVEGWVQNSMTKEVVDKIESISILRLDMDIYEPTKFVLEKLYPKMSNGSILIIDDWALEGARLACEEYFEENEISLELKTIENSTPVYFIIKK
jgi:hypothetical protein